MFPVNLVSFQNLLQLRQQLLYTEDHSQLLEAKQQQEVDRQQIYPGISQSKTDRTQITQYECVQLDIILMILFR